jgi:hypothetical protein
VFVTSQGSAYSQFKRALERRNFLLAWTTAAELPKVPLADALLLLLPALDQQPWRFETAAPRWHARLCHEARLTLPEAQLALAALDAQVAGQYLASGRAAAFGRPVAEPVQRPRASRQGGQMTVRCTTVQGGI